MNFKRLKQPIDSFVSDSDIRESEETAMVYRKDVKDLHQVAETNRDLLYSPLSASNFVQACVNLWWFTSRLLQLVVTSLPNCAKPGETT